MAPFREEEEEEEEEEEAQLLQLSQIRNQMLNVVKASVLERRKKARPKPPTATPPSPIPFQ